MSGLRNGAEGNFLHALDRHGDGRDAREQPSCANRPASQLSDTTSRNARSVVFQQAPRYL